MISIKDARERICPMSNANPSSSINCLTTKCMAWEAAPELLTRFSRACVEPSATVEPKRPPSIPASWVFVPYDEDADIAAHWTQPEHEWRERQFGRCTFTIKG